MKIVLEGNDLAPVCVMLADGGVISGEDMTLFILEDGRQVYSCGDTGHGVDELAAYAVDADGIIVGRG